MIPVLILPGIGNSGPEHWQSRWQALEPSLRRIQVPNWDEPELSAWVTAIDAEVSRAAAPPVIAAHSLGCLAVAHWARQGGLLHAALLVAVPDPEGPEFPSVARSFGPVPLERLPFPTHVVASRNDPYASFDFARRCASAWASDFTDVGNAGHINAQSGLGDWPAGRALLSGLLG